MDAVAKANDIIPEITENLLEKIEWDTLIGTPLSEGKFKKNYNTKLFCSSDNRQHAHESVYLNILLSQINLRNSNIQAAINICEETLDFVKKTLGSDNTLTFNTLKILIDILIQEKNYDKAIKLIESFPLNFNTRNLHAIILRHMGSIYYESCLHSQEKIIEVRLKQFDLKLNYTSNCTLNISPSIYKFKISHNFIITFHKTCK